MIDEDLKKFLPTFLPNGEQEELFYNLRQLVNGDISRIKNFYSGSYGSGDSVLEQGDGMEGLPIFNLPSTESRSGKGFVISNTCDVNADNDRSVPMRMLYAPVLNLEKYEEALRRQGEYSKSWADAVRKQQITHLFYLPKGSGLGYEAIVPLDHIHSLASGYLSDDTISSSRVFKLSLTGWYILLIKLTYHFARTTNQLIARKSSAIAL